MLMGQFSNGGVTLHIPDGDVQNDVKAAHDEALQPVDLWLQQHSAFCTISHTHPHTHAQTLRLRTVVHIKESQRVSNYF